MEIPTAFSDDGNTKSRRRRAREEKKTSDVGNNYFDNNLENEKDHGSKNVKMMFAAWSLGSKNVKMMFAKLSLGMFSLKNRPCHCMGSTRRFCWRHQRFIRDDKQPFSLPSCLSMTTGKRSKRDSIWIILSLLLVCIYLLPNLFSVHQHHRRRTTSDAEVDRLDLVIPILDFKEQKVDIGGWLFPQQRITPRAPIKGYIPSKEEEDFGGLNYVSTGGLERKINSNDLLLYEKYAAKKMTERKYKRMSSANEHADEIEDENHTCRRPNWILLYKPSCNAIHALDMSRDYDEEMVRVGDDQIFDSFYVNHGYYRDVWVVKNFGLDENFMMKKSRYKYETKIGVFHSTLRDALIMERLTVSPRIIDIYGHCGETVLVEAIPFEVEEYIVPGDGYIKQEDLHDKVDVTPLNKYTIEEKLQTAIEMAESLADLHGFKDGVIVHDDVQICQWLRKDDSKLKLGDFNRAEIMEYNSEEQKYCKYQNGQGWGNYRSPEEFGDHDLNEKIDVFTFGNNIYGLLTGLWVFYENEDDGVVQKKVKRGEKAYIDPRYRARSFIEGKLVEIMEKCWELDPDKRVDIFEVVKFLREVLKESNRRGNPNKE